MKHSTIVETQNALAQSLRAKLRENDGQYDMVSSTLMAALGSFEVAAQMALLNDSLAALGGAGDTTAPASLTITQNPTNEPPEGVKTQNALSEKPIPPSVPARPKGVKTIPRVPAPAGGGRVVKRVVKGEVVAPAPSPKKPEPRVADLIQPPVDNATPEGEGDNYPENFDLEASEGHEMDEVLQIISRGGEI